MKKIFIFILLSLSGFFTKAEDGYDLWLRYKKINNNSILSQYKALINSVVISGNSATINIARQELVSGLQGLLGKPIPELQAIKSNSIVVHKKPIGRYESP